VLYSHVDDWQKYICPVKNAATLWVELGMNIGKVEILLERSWCEDRKWRNGWNLIDVIGWEGFRHAMLHSRMLSINHILIGRWKVCGKLILDDLIDILLSWHCCGIVLFVVTVLFCYI
jgi:hypothetical protein